MLIVNKETFLTLPEGTLFYKLSESLNKTSDLLIKEETWEDDFRYYTLTDVEGVDESGDEFDILYKMKNNHVSENLDISIYRDGLFDKDTFYMVYEEKDIIKLISFFD